MSYIGTSKVGSMYLGSTKIAKAYLGDNLVYSAEPPDPTLIAYWNGADAAVSKNWSDRIGSKRWNIYYTYTKGANYYQFDNIANSSQFATLTDNDFGVDYEIKVVVDFELNPDGTNNMVIFDFGAIGVTASGNWGFCARANASGDWTASAKYNGNNSVASTTSGTPPVFETGVWTAGTVEAGIELNGAEDKQRVFLKIGDYSIVSDWKDKIKIKPFAAAGNNARLATTCIGIGSTTYSRSRVRIKTMKVYNVANQSSGGGDTPSTLPYDAQVEYLQSSGTQYIDTGINAQSVRRFVVSGYCYVNGNNNTQLLGGEGQGASTFFGARVSGQTHWYCTNNGSGLGEPTHRSTIDATINSTSSQTGTLTDLTNNTTYNFTSFGSSSWSFPNSNLLLFGGYSTRRSPNARCYSLQIYTDSGLVRDLIPVRVGTTGYMYDKVSGELFGNNGTGSFTLGNDKS